MVSTYSVGSHGYAQIGWNEGGHRRVTLVHRVVWASTHGPIPGHLTVDHMCKNRQCMNVEHLRLLSNYENARRTGGRDWPLGRCINGHPNANLKKYEDGRTHCSICVETVWKSKPKGSERERKPKVVKVPATPRTHCRNGHEKTAANTYLRPSGHKECLPCKQEYARRWRRDSAA
ncbi:MAG: HNH endonuclease signature motif containing protein [Actinomycetes bacterium]